MNFEKPQFNNPEDKPESSIEGRKMSKVESERMLGEMDEYIEGLKVILTEKQTELKKLQENTEANSEKISEINVEIEELEEQINGLGEYSEEGKEEGAEFFEKGSESIPTPEEVQSVFEQLIGEKEYKDIRKLEDEQGLYLWDIIVSGEGGDVEYSYMRKGKYSEGEASVTVIHVTFFDEEGIPVGGHSVAKNIDGEWKLTP